jgi:hypothetical protein
MRAPWGFLRNTDDRYGVKVVAEEASGFLDWQITPDIYKMADVFPRLKALGFTKLGELRQFMEGLYDAIEETNYDLEEVAQICQRNLGSDGEVEATKEEAKQRRSAAKLQKLNVPDKSKVLTELDVGKLKEIARNFMEDAHDIANVWRHETKLNPKQTAYNLRLRRFRQVNSWLMANLSGLDRFNRVSDDETTIFYGLRSEPHEEGDRPLRHIAMVANMGGEPMTVTLSDWLQIDWSEWSVAIASPELDIGDTPEDWRAFELKDSQAVLFEKIG